MSSSQNDESDTVKFSEIVEYETRNLAGCDNDDSCCTFPKGYVYRQALYLCITCLKKTGKQAGICYPCSINCHSDHHLLDLFTKRNFRCDCGNEKFSPDFTCKLWEDKDDLNKGNIYNHNFSGLFCKCDSEYKETEESEDMYQCNICEDWYHLEHLSDNIDELTAHKSMIEASTEFTCKTCLDKHDYLRIYNKAITNNLSLICAPATCSFLANKEMLSESETTVLLSCGSFWPEDWRQSLCTCSSCKITMENDGIRFLLDEKDSMSYYYREGESSNQDAEDLKEVLSEIPYTQAITIAEGIAKFKREFSKFMNSQDPDTVVTSDDINNFFNNLKRRRLDEHE